MVAATTGRHRALRAERHRAKPGRHRAPSQRPSVQFARPASCSEKSEARRSLAVGGYLVFAYIASNELLVGLPNAALYTYVGLPMLWGGLGLLAYLAWRRLSGRARATRLLVMLAATTAVVQLALVTLVAFVGGLGRSPYANGVLAMAGNAIYVLALIAGFEATRAYLYEAWLPVLRSRTVIVIALLMGIVALPLARYKGLDSIPGVLETVGQGLLPGLAESLAATAFVSVGGPLASAAYLGLLTAFEWFSPILPDLGWAAAALVGTAAPILALTLTRRSMPGILGQEDPNAARDGYSLRSLALGFVLVLLIWLNVGLFGVVPSVVVGQSMEPAFHTGDVVYVQEVEADDLSIGDVIKFTVSGEPVVHRIVEMAGDPEAPVIVTQGDNNAAPDSPIVSDQVEGRVAFTVSKIGWCHIWLKRLAALF